MNKIIVDGYNLIHAIPELAEAIETSLEHARNLLLARLKSYTIRKSVAVIVVFDGTQPPLGVDEPVSTRNLIVKFSRTPFKADPLIMNLVRQEPNRKSLTVVSDDREIGDFARQNNAGVLSSQAFFERITRRSEAGSRHVEQKFNSEMSDEELAEWMRLFGEK